MYTFVLLAVLGILLGIVLMQLFKKPPSNEPVADLANLKVTDARAGDAISISGAGDNYADLDFTADRMTRFAAGARNWFELSGPYAERRVILRVGAGDEELEVSLHADKNSVSLEDLGLSEEDLAEMDERQNTADNFPFDGKSWQYRISREVHATRSDQAVSVGFYYWEFQEQGGKGLIAIRKMEGEPFAVTRYTRIPAADVTVYRK
jgi:hypothetical protein